MNRVARMKYKRLARNRTGLGKRHSLWLADDHLLAVESTGYSEDYTRYYLKDIQAITARLTAAGKAWNAVLSLAGAVVLYHLVTGIADGSAPATAASVFFAVPVCALLVANIIQGPTCKCHILMPLGVRELPSVGRVKTLEKLLTRIRPLIGRYQGSMPDPDLPEQESDTPFPSAGPAPKKPVSGQTGNLADSGYGGGFHYAAFSLLLVDAAFCVLQIFYNDRALMALSAVLNLALIACIIMALVRQYEHHTPPISGKLVWGALIMMVTGFIYVYLFAIFSIISQFKGNVKTQGDILAAFANIKPIDHPALAVFAFCYAGLSACIGAAGLVSYGRGRVARNITLRDSES